MRKWPILSFVVCLVSGPVPTLPPKPAFAETFPSFRHVVIDPQPATDRSIVLEKAWGDIRKDGKLDAVVGLGENCSHKGGWYWKIDAVMGLGRGACGKGGLYWYERPAGGIFAGPWIKHTIAPRGNFYEDIAIFDVNGDGAPDIIASVDNKIVWYENPLDHGGNPAKDPWRVHTIRAKGGAHVLLVGDIDGDGKADITLSSSGVLGSTGAIMFQNTPDSWTEVRFGAVHESVALLDIGSGNGPINIVGGDGNDVVWYENPRETGGDARSGAWIRHVAAKIRYAREDSLATGIFFSSGRMDAIIASNEDYPDNPSGLYRIIAPDNRRTPWTVQTIDSTYQAVHKINLGDINKDGNLDIIVAEQEQAHNVGPGFDQNFNKQRVAIFYNDGNGNFTQQVVATTGGQNQVLGDLEGDGDLDILSANHGYYGAPHPLEIWVNQLSQGTLRKHPD